jgi:hypothetical protein
VRGFGSCWTPISTTVAIAESRQGPLGVTISEVKSVD